jgi:metal-responsive CopG/Arc/MetJ family transcriptional regulator
MKTIRVGLEQALLRRVDRTAHRLKKSRSAVVRDALLRHVREIEIQALEEADRRGYERVPDSEFAVWNAAISWPDQR